MCTLRKNNKSVYGYNMCNYFSMVFIIIIITIILFFSFFFFFNTIVSNKRIISNNTKPEYKIIYTHECAVLSNYVQRQKLKLYVEYCSENNNDTLRFTCILEDFTFDNVYTNVEHK